MPSQIAVVAIGGNSLIQSDERREVRHQWDAVRQTCEHIAQLVKQGWRVLITHGNGPQSVSSCGALSWRRTKCILCRST